MFWHDFIDKIPICGISSFESHVPSCDPALAGSLARRSRERLRPGARAIRLRARLHAAPGGPTRARTARGAPFTLDELDARFAALYRDLEASGLCRRRPDVPPIVAKVVWLRAQQQYIEWLARAAVRRLP
jgi:hypothetical protein